MTATPARLTIVDEIHKLAGFDPMPDLEGFAPTVRAAAAICQKQPGDLAATAAGLMKDEELGLELLGSLADAQRYLQALGEMVGNAELKLLAAMAQSDA